MQPRSSPDDCIQTAKQKVLQQRLEQSLACGGGVCLRLCVARASNSVEHSNIQNRANRSLLSTVFLRLRCALFSRLPPSPRFLVLLRRPHSFCCLRLLAILAGPCLQASPACTARAMVEPAVTPSHHWSGGAVGERSPWTPDAAARDLFSPVSTLMGNLRLDIPKPGGARPPHCALHCAPQNRVYYANAHAHFLSRALQGPRRWSSSKV